MKKHLSTAALILALLAGVSLLLYPTVSNYWNARHASRAVANYTQEVQALDRDAYDRMLAEEVVRLVSDGIQIEPLLVAPVVALPMLLALLLVLLLSGNKPPHRDDEDSGPN